MFKRQLLTHTTYSRTYRALRSPFLLALAIGEPPNGLSRIAKDSIKMPKSISLRVFERFDEIHSRVLGLNVLEFQFAAIQLNRLSWRDFLQQHNPVAAALMAKMSITASERPRVKAQCLRLLTTLKLDPARMQLILGFVDTYLKLDAIEEQVFQMEIGTMEVDEREEVMEIVTSWEERGIQAERRATITEVLKLRFGDIDAALESIIPALLQLSPSEYMQLILQGSRSQLLARFQSQ